MARTAKKISQLDPAPGGALAGDQFVIERGGVAPNYRLDFAAIVAAVSVGVDATFLDSAANLSDVADVPTARTNLGLGSMALEATAAWLSKAGNLAGLVDLPTSRTNLGLGTGDSPTFVTLNLSTSLSRISGGFSTILDNASMRMGVPGGQAAAIRLSQTGFTDFTWNTTPSVGSQMHSGGANAFEWRNGAAAVTHRIYANFVDTGNYERLTIATVASGTASILKEQAGTGSVGGLRIGTTGAGNVQIRANGADVWFWDATTGAFRCNTDNAQDIGASGANRPRNVFIAGVVRADGTLVAKGATATPAGGAQVLVFGTTSAFGVYIGSGVPTVAAGKGSLYLRSDGTGPTDRAYVNTDGAATWTALNTVA